MVDVVAVGNFYARSAIVYRFRQAGSHLHSFEILNMPHDPTLPALAPSSRSRRRKWLWTLPIGLIAALLLTLALPTLLGSKWIYQPILKRLAQDKFELEVDSVQLQWFSQLEFNGVSIRHSEEPNSAPSPPLLTIQSVKSNRGLLGYLLNGRDLGRVEILEPKVDIALLESGSNLEKLIKAMGESSRGEESNVKSQPKLDLDIAIRGLSVQLDPSGGEKTFQVIPPMNADISYRALSDEPHIIVKPTQILNHVELTPELVRLGLGLAIPLLSKSAWFDGSVSLATQEIRIPLEQPSRSTGEAVLILHQVRSGPSEPLIVGALDALSRLRNKEPNHELVFVDGSQVVVKVADERVFHSGLQAGFPRLDPRLQVATEGYVGLTDRSLDLQLEIPIPVEQLARRETVQSLGVPRVKLPIGGSLDQPEVKWDVMRAESATLLAVISNRLQDEAPITSTIVDAISGVTEGQADQAIEAAVDFVRKLRERRSQSTPDPRLEPENAKEPKEPKEPETEKRRPLRDALRKAIRGDQ
jgi:hypothetical protein